MSPSIAMNILWPSFLMACLLEMVIFGYVDPKELYLSDSFNNPRLTIHAISFFIFWIICAFSSAISVAMYKTITSKDK